MEIKRTESANAVSVPPKPQAPKAPAPSKGTNDQVRTGPVAVETEAARLQRLRASVEAAQQGQEPEESYAPTEVKRPPYTGGAPALKPDQMDEALVKNNLILRLLYGVRHRAPWALRGYQSITKVIGPLGAWLNFGYNAWTAKNILTDPKAPGFLKGSIIGSTALAGVSAAAATRVGLHAFNIMPMATEGAKLMGKVAGVAGLGAGTLLSAMDTFNTFRNPDATNADKGLSLLTTGASAGLTLTVLMGITGPIGIGLGVAVIGLSLFKGPLGRNRYVRAAFDWIAKAGSGVVDGAKKVGGAIADGAKRLWPF